MPDSRRRAGPADGSPSATSLRVHEVLEHGNEEDLTPPAHNPRAAVGPRHAWPERPLAGRSRRHYPETMTARALADDSGDLEHELRERRALLARTGETYMALAERLDDEIAALEAARRLATERDDEDFEAMLEAAERETSGN